MWWLPWLASMVCMVWDNISHPRDISNTWRKLLQRNYCHNCNRCTHHNKLSFHCGYRHVDQEKQQRNSLCWVLVKKTSPATHSSSSRLLMLQQGCSSHHDGFCLIADSAHFRRNTNLFLIMDFSIFHVPPSCITS